MDLDTKRYIDKKTRYSKKIVGDTPTDALSLVNKKYVMTRTFTAVAPVTLVDATTIVTDASTGSFFSVTLTGNRTLANPTNAVDGQRIIFEIIQDNIGGRTLAFGNAFAFGATITSIVLSTTANLRDFIGVIYRATTGKFYVVAYSNGY